MINKRGDSEIPVWVWIILIIGLIFGILALFAGPLFDSLLWGKITSSASSAIDSSTVSIASVSPSLAFLDYIFGQIPTFLANLTTGEYSPLIIVLAMWLLIFITFGDIITTFGSFGNKQIGWIVGLLLAIIVANLKGIVFILAFIIGIFSFVGGLAVALGIITAFVAFLGVNFGIRSMAPWIMRRRAMMESQRFDINAERGAEKVKASIDALTEIGEKLAQGGKKKS